MVTAFFAGGNFNCRQQGILIVADQRRLFSPVWVTREDSGSSSRFSWTVLHEEKGKAGWFLV
jgi:hypothetical protein